MFYRMLKNAQLKHTAGPDSSKHATGITKYGGEWLIHNLFGLNQDGLIIAVEDGLFIAVHGNVAVVSPWNKAMLWNRDLRLLVINVFQVRDNEFLFWERKKGGGKRCSARFSQRIESIHHLIDVRLTVLLKDVVLTSVSAEQRFYWKGNAFVPYVSC